MIKKYKIWYSNLTALKKLTVSFILNWFYWLIAWLIAEQIFFDENRSWKYHVFHATWMAFFMTIPFNWKELKEIVKPQKQKNQKNQSSETDIG